MSKQLRLSIGAMAPSIEEADIGEWDDDHPLNNTKKQKAEFDRLFPTPTIPEGQWLRTDSENDKPQDWLFTSLVFAKALGKILKETEGVVVTPENDILKFMPFSDKTQSLIIHRENGQVKIMDLETEHTDGEMVWLHKTEEDTNETI